MEGLIAHDEPEDSEAPPQPRSGVSRFLVSCPICVDMNAKDFEKKGLREEEILPLQGKTSMDRVATLGEKEKAAYGTFSAYVLRPFPSLTALSRG